MSITHNSEMSSNAQNNFNPPNSRKRSSIEKIYGDRFKSNEKRLSCILENKIKKSLIGTVVEISENLSTQDRDDMWELLKLDRVESPRRYDDLLCTDMIDSIEQALISSLILTRSAVFNQITNLRLMDCGIEEMDDSLTGLNNLKLLNLSGNWIKYITGTQLPRNLGILEMFSNEVSSVRSLCENLPETLLHIGLGRNRISDDSELCALSKNEFSMLRSLDLSDNDIVDIIQVSEDLSGIPHLLILELRGNPCSMCYFYREVVLAKLSRLQFLDGYAVSRQEDEQCFSENQLRDGAEGGALCFYCYRIMGIPQPDRNEVHENKKVVPKYYIEVQAPLLSKQPQNEEENSSNYSQQTEIEAEPEPEPEPSFKTPLLMWKPILEFPAPCVTINATGFEGLKNLRDTFKSNVSVRLVFVRTVQPEKPKKNASVPATPMEDVILSETTLAEFSVPLQTVTWAQASIDYSWEKISEEFSGNAKLISGCAKDLIYKGSSPKKQTKNVSPRLASLPIPDILTLHLGFGLQRTIPDPEKFAIATIEENLKKKGK